MSGYAGVLKDRFGVKPTKICENFYTINKQIVCICSFGSFVFCPVGFNRSRPERFERHFIWTLECDEPDTTLKEQIHRIRTRDKDSPQRRRCVPIISDDEAA